MCNPCNTKLSKQSKIINIIDEYNGTKAANLSHYYLGICYRNTGEYEFAIDELKSFSSDDIMISTVAIGAIADCYMELNDFDKAINYYEKAVSNGDNKLTSPIYLFKAGLAYEDNQDFDGAEEKYKVTLLRFYHGERKAVLFYSTLINRFYFVQKVAPLI